METGLLWMEHIGVSLLQLITQPFYYVAILFVAVPLFRQMSLERQMFAVKLHDWKLLLIKAVAAGFAAGMMISIAGIWIGAALTAEALLWLWIVAVLLMLIRIRYLCFAYAAGIIAIMQWIVGFTPLAERSDWVGTIAVSLEQIETAGLLLLTALLHLAEALLVRWQGAKLSTPLFLEGKRGKLIGGYMLQGFWPVPLLMLVPATSGGLSLPWPPLFAEGGSAGWTFVAFPVVIGFTEMTRSMLPEQKARHSSNQLLIYSSIIAIVSLAAWQWPIAMLPAAAVLSILLHEAMVWRSRYKENTRSPIFVNNTKGLRILGIVPGTPAEAMGLLPGEMVSKVNGEKVNTKEQMYSALMINPAFCKLEVLNRDGEIKFAQRTRYAGEHHQLGIILAPDDQATYFAQDSSDLSFIHLIKTAKTANKREKLTKNSQTMD